MDIFTRWQMCKLYATVWCGMEEQEHSSVNSGGEEYQHKACPSTAIQLTASQTNPFEEGNVLHQWANEHGGKLCLVTEEE